MSAPIPIIAFERATLVRLGGDVAFRDLDWVVRDGETWAVTGPVGSGKSSLLEAIAGRLRAVSGTAHVPEDGVRLVAFREEAGPFSYRRHYYQQRFNFVESHEDVTLAAFLEAGATVSVSEVRAAADRLGVGHLLDRSFIHLSNGQSRRARLARALLARPRLLLLDEPFLGLDAPGRVELADHLGELVQGGTRLVLATRSEAIPSWVTHALELDNLGVRRVLLPSPHAGEGLGVRGEGRTAAESYRPASHSHPSPPAPLPHGERGAKAPVVELRDVRVAYGERVILDGLNWAVCAGERWAVLGPNGSGKLTLLSLLCGDHPQAYANDVRLFGRRRGTGESIWDVKAKVGLVSPELHLYHAEPLTASEVVGTGFHDTIARQPVTIEQAARARSLFAEFGVAPLADRPFLRLSAGEQRLVLLLRALVKRAPLLILDEPFGGLDTRTAERARDWLDAHLGSDQTLLFVTHYADEIPRTVDRVLRLEGGRAV